jgi:hypothetical protein
MILRVILLEFELIGLLVFLMISMFSSMFLYYGLSSLKQFVFDPNHKTIEIIYLGMFKRIIVEDEVKGFCSFPFVNRIRTYEGILLELKNQKQYQLSEFDIKNFKEIQLAISSFIIYKKDLRLRIWTNFNKALVVISALVLFLLIFSKILSLI